MKIARTDANGHTRQMLLKEYFLNAYLIALLKKVGEESARLRKPALGSADPDSSAHSFAEPLRARSRI
jgi:hypothetical protein